MGLERSRKMIKGKATESFGMIFGDVYLLNLVKHGYLFEMFEPDV